MRINKKVIAAILLAITFLTVLYVSTIVTYRSGKGNPYDLYGQGNCVKFTVDCMERFWPMTPDIPRKWDAYRWTELVGTQKDGYIIEQVSEPKPGDVYVIPKTDKNRYGHVGMIVGICWEYSLETGTREQCYTVIESKMHATEQGYPMVYKGCRYRQVNCPVEHLEALGTVFLRCALN